MTGLFERFFQGCFSSEDSAEWSLLHRSPLEVTWSCPGSSHDGSHGASQAESSQKLPEHQPGVQDVPGAQLADKSMVLAPPGALYWLRQEYGIVSGRSIVWAPPGVWYCLRQEYCMAPAGVQYCLRQEYCIVSARSIALSPPGVLVRNKMFLHNGICFHAHARRFVKLDRYPCTRCGSVVPPDEHYPYHI